jgi:hypothetical protein
MTRKDFVDLFVSKLYEGSDRKISSLTYSLLMPRMLVASIPGEEVSKENHLEIKGSFAIKMITAGTEITDSLAALRAFDDVVDAFVLDKESKKEDKVRPK